MVKGKLISYTQLDDASLSQDTTDEAEEEEESILNRLRLIR
jgi:hypothetical protein